MTAMLPDPFVLYPTVGFAFGAAYFVLLLRATRLHALRASLVRVMPFHVGRFVSAAATFWLIAQQGALPVMLALLGFVVARFCVQARVVR